MSLNEYQCQAQAESENVNKIKCESSLTLVYSESHAV